MNPIECPFDNTLLKTLLKELSTLHHIPVRKMDIASEGISLDKINESDSIIRRYEWWYMLQRSFIQGNRWQFTLLYEMIVYFVKVYRYYVINRVIRFKDDNKSDIRIDANNHIISAKYDCNTELLYRNFHNEPLNTIKKLMMEHNTELSRLLTMKDNEDITKKSTFGDYDVYMEQTYITFDVELRLQQTKFDKKLLIDTLKYITQSYIGMCIGLKSLDLPFYVVQWILDWLDYTVDDAILYRLCDVPQSKVCMFQGFNLNRNKQSHKIPVFNLLTNLKKLRIIESVQTLHTFKQNLK